MPRTINVSLVPNLIDASKLPGSMAVVIDVLRASTTITAALANGATRVIPFLSVEETKRFADQNASTHPEFLLGGERGGVRIDGFDLGNSPDDYGPSVVADKTLLFTTTNGTKAILAANQADWVGIGCFANRAAIAKQLIAGDGDIQIVCAGTNGLVTLEDTLAAGAIISELQVRSKDMQLGNDEARLALTLHNANATLANRIEAMKSSHGGQNLLALGYEQDIIECARTDKYSVVPILEQGYLTASIESETTDDAADWSI